MSERKIICPCCKEEITVLKPEYCHECKEEILEMNRAKWQEIDEMELTY